MDLFTVPDPSDSGMGYAYIFMIFVLIAASFTVYKLKKFNKTKQEAESPKAYDMYESNKKDKNS
ncbi:hypothetical protein CR203_20065 [Salipaludibacillus neizhouensis]|uniref:Uncharacterized protein n=1 Tax=Salipaludibacillus neizhouensis TaxID=885475 RepID=A0A3A9JYQ2_9BACI|nr:hypothetical protein [Salipaludibacillus neizhouensis]RKL65617.1 hypothetical protein CR203_20065 [Salipaludibacillus neizhouensis]